MAYTYCIYSNPSGWRPSVPPDLQLLCGLRRQPCLPLLLPRRHLRVHRPHVHLRHKA